MKDIVIILTYDRPELLELCLQQIQRADGWKIDKHYLFVLDYGYNPEMMPIIDKFEGDHSIYKVDKPEYYNMKQSKAVLEGYVVALELANRYIYYIEDDVLIGKEFFKFHEAVQEQVSNLFCSIAVENTNNPYWAKQEPDKYYITNCSKYRSLGVCWNKDILKKYIIEHENSEYYSNPSKYISEHFTEYPKTVYTEQDGLINAIYSKLYNTLNIAFPNMPRAFHAGYYSRYRGIQSKYSIKELLADKELLKSVVGKVSFYLDSRPCSLEITCNEFSLDNTALPRRYKSLSNEGYLLLDQIQNRILSDQNTKKYEYSFNRAQLEEVINTGKELKVEGKLYKEPDYILTPDRAKKILQKMDYPDLSRINYCVHEIQELLTKYKCKLSITNNEVQITKDDYNQLTTMFEANNYNYINIQNTRAKIEVIPK